MFFVVTRRGLSLQMMFFCKDEPSGTSLFDESFSTLQGFKNLRGLKNYLLGVIIKSEPEISVLKSFKPAFCNI